MKTLKFCSFFLLLIMLQIEVKAQQIPLYSQYYYNPFLYNPARTGEKEDVQLYLMYRKQWADFKGAPETRAISLDGMIKNKIGLGGYLYSDVEDILQRLSGHLAYAYYFKFGEHKLSLGVSAGVQEVRADLRNAQVDDINDNILGESRRGLNFDASAGISYWFKGLQVGFAVPQILGTNIKYSNESETSYRMSRHYLATVGYTISLADDVFFIEPNAMFRAAKRFDNFQIDVGSVFRYKDLVWLSALYRYDYAISIGGGFRVHDRVSVGYSTDVVLNSLQDYAGGTHEILLGITFGKKDKQEKGLVETIKNLESKQQQQASEIAEIKQENEDLKEQNEQLAESIKVREQEMEQIKIEITEAVRAQQRAENDNDIQQETEPAIESNESEPTVPKNEKTQPYIIVLGAYVGETNARKKMNELKQKNLNTDLYYNKSKNIYYIYLKDTGDLQQGQQRLDQLKRDTQFKDAWIFHLPQ